jgi:hypothetical protein
MKKIALLCIALAAIMGSLALSLKMWLEQRHEPKSAAVTAERGHFAPMRPKLHPLTDLGIRTGPEVLPRKTPHAELQEQEGRTTKLKILRDLMGAGGYRETHLATILSSDESLWLKAAYLQVAMTALWGGVEADRATANVVAFLATFDVTDSKDPMVNAVYQLSMQFLTTLNRREGGKYDTILKTRFDNTHNPDYLKTIVDPAFKSERIREVSHQDAVAIVSESPTEEYLEFAKFLRTAPDINPTEKGDLDKYIQKHSTKNQWQIAEADDSKTKLMKLNGVSESNTSGKSRYIYHQWLDIYFSKLTDDMSHAKRQALPNPTYELASALWTEKDHQTRRKVEAEILRLFEHHHGTHSPDTKSTKKIALANLAVSYLDLCLSNLAPKDCRDEFVHPQSFGATVAREYLASYLGKPNASMVLGISKSYVEKIAISR